MKTKTTDDKHDKTTSLYLCQNSIIDKYFN